MRIYLCFFISICLLFGCEQHKSEMKVGIILSEQYLSKKVFDTDGKLILQYEKPMKNDTVWVDWDFGDTAITETSRKLSSATTDVKRVRFAVTNGTTI